MDVVLWVGLLTVAVAVAVVQWQLLVRPEIFLALWGNDLSPRWWEVHPGVLRLVRWSAGSVLFALGLLTGITLAVIAVSQ